MFFQGVGRRSGPSGAGNRIWAVGGGKGGTGKSLLTANLGICLARMGHRVCLVDADLGTANLHTFVGLEPPRQTLSHLLERRVSDIHDLIVWTDIPGLALIAGSRDVIEVANLKYAQKIKLLRHIRRLDFDFVLLDLGAGTNFNVVDFFLISDAGILNTSPEPTAVENTYRFIKSFYYRVLARTIKNHNLKTLVHDALHGRTGRIVHNPLELIEAVQAHSPETGRLVIRELESFSIKLTVNQVRTSNDFQVGRYISSACRKYFGLELDFAGSVVYDDQVWRSVRLRQPFMASHPHNLAAQNIRTVCTAILDGSPAMVRTGSPQQKADRLLA